MALSWNFFPDRDTIIKAALRRIRAYDPEDATTISTVQYNNAAETLNFLLTSWQADGLQVWAIKTSSAQTLTASDGDYTVGATGNIAISRPLDIIRAWLRTTSDSTDVPLEIITKERYDLLTNKTTEGTPTSLYYDAGYDGSSNQGTNSTGTIYLWPEPDSTCASAKKLMFVYQRPFLDFNASTDNLDMPQEWYEAVRINLAYKIAPEYGMPVIEYDRLKNEAIEAKIIAMGWDREKGSIFIQPWSGR